MNGRQQSEGDGRLTHELIRSTGRGAGLRDCGVASCAPSDHAAQLDAWLARGAHGTMEWMARTAEARKDLRSKWEWARSALVGVVSYLTEPVERDELGGIARHVSRYARGRDYHDVLKSRLTAWGDALERHAGAPFRRVALVDTSAVLERELAARAGLGWFGKNTCLIGPRGDSWRFIGVLLTDLELAETGPPPEERCGTCTACLDACPTGAIREPWFVDATSCISYLTIELRGESPPEWRSAIGDWVFGCDVCQEVCPWNRRAVPADEPGLAVDPAYEEISLAELAAMDEQTFRERFRGSPLRRPKRAGMVRNALIVGANIGDPELLSVAGRLVDDPDPGVRDAARWAVGASDRGRTG
jgi:epoxyqueuosine reductase